MHMEQSHQLVIRKNLKQFKRVFGENEYGKIPAIASTKSLSGHALGAAGSNEAIYSLIMMNKSFLTPSLNIDQIDPAGEGRSF